ncbi:unnamed protein product [Citrullus colocynthis]|uniref:Uncharacterized protein n=1 Tax=Citrullus colocynthis TaxID=252529 RepID=A0ABP0Y671_9ROSI
MLESRHAENNISDVGCSGVNDDGDDEDDETRKTVAKTEIRHDDFDDDPKMEIGKKGFGKAKQVMFYPFRKAKKQILRRRIKRASSSSSSSSPSSSSSVTCTRRTSSSDKRGFDGSVNQGCGFCFAKLSISDSKNGSPTDPNHRKFTYEMLKVLIEKNDFYSKESNPHLDVQVRQKH